MKEILQILNDLYLGEHYFEALLTLRQSLLLSVLTSNLEVTFNMTKKEVKMLDDVDTSLLRAAMMVSAKSPRALLFLELGICSIEFVLKSFLLAPSSHSGGAFPG